MTFAVPNTIARPTERRLGNNGTYKRDISIQKRNEFGMLSLLSGKSTPFSYEKLKAEMVLPHSKFDPKWLQKPKPVAKPAREYPRTLFHEQSASNMALPVNKTKIQAKRIVKYPGNSFENLIAYAKSLNITTTPEMTENDIRDLIYPCQMKKIQDVEAKEKECERRKYIAKRKRQIECFHKNLKHPEPDQSLEQVSASRYHQKHENDQEKENRKSSDASMKLSYYIKKCKEEEHRKDTVAEVDLRVSRTSTAIESYDCDRENLQLQHNLLSALYQDIQCSKQHIMKFNIYQAEQMKIAIEKLKNLAGNLKKKPVREHMMEYKRHFDDLAILILHPDTFSARTRAFSAWVVVMLTQIKLPDYLLKDLDLIVPDVVTLRKELEMHKLISKKDCYCSIRDNLFADKDLVRKKAISDFSEYLRFLTELKEQSVDSGIGSGSNSPDQNDWQ